MVILGSLGCHFALLAASSSSAGGKQTGSAIGTVGKISHTWKHMRLLTRTLLVFALAGILYLGFFAGARRHYKKQKLSDPMI